MALSQHEPHENSLRVPNLPAYDARIGSCNGFVLHCVALEGVTGSSGSDHVDLMF